MSDPPQLQIELYQTKYHKEVFQFGLDIPYRQSFYSASWSYPTSLASRVVIFSTVFALSGFSFWALGVFFLGYEVFLQVYTFYTWPEFLAF